MSLKKELMANYFKNDGPATIPSGKNNIKNKNTSEKSYKTHKLYENPDDIHNISNSDKILSVEPAEIKNWKYSDRPEAELGDIDSLAAEFKTIGQQQPCIVRTTNNSKKPYELIAGERRWRAAILANVKLKVILKDISDTEAALIQATENESRKNLSDYAKGIQFYRLIENKIIKAKELTEKLGKSKQYISALLSFGKIPQKIIKNIGDMTNVSARTAEKIKQLSARGEIFEEAIITLAGRIRTGKLGHGGIERELLKVMHKQAPSDNTEKRKVLTRDGRHICTWRFDNNGILSVHFPKSINDLFTGSKIDRDDFTEELISLFVTKFKGI
jgi:ParB family transcriptional regulator, chromosome partitioning protein